MANIYLLIDLGIGGMWLDASMRANQHLLAANGIDLVPFDSDRDDFVPRNTLFWYASASDPLPPDLAEKLAVVRSSLDRGRSVLFLGQTVDLTVQKEFFSFLRAHLHPETHPVIPIMVVGKPAMSMELWWRNTPEGVDAPLAGRYIRYARKLFQLLLLAEEEWGKEQTTLIPDLRDAVTASGTAEICARVFNVLGIEAPPVVAAPLPFGGFTSTTTAVRLLEARQVRHNDWPRLDNTAYMTALQGLDRQWGPEPLSPLAYRQSLLEQGREDQERLERFLGLPAHSLDAPDWYGTLPEMDAATPLRPERLRAFAESLAPPERDVLIRRFANDHDLLSRDQRDLALALAQTKEGRLSGIGEPRERPTLTVLTMTRNHEKYIGQCIESVLAQKTDFPVRHLILDHYSADETPWIVSRYAREYPSIRPVLLNNYHQTYNNVHDLFIRCRSEYAALCDGDDYFIDPLKLQKQMNFLQSHPRCSLCFHPVAVVFENGEKESFIFPSPLSLPRGIQEEYYLADLIKCNIIQTNSVVYKWRFREGLPEWFHSKLCPGDWYWHLLHAEQGRIGFLREIMAVYRRHSNSLYQYSFINRVEHRRRLGMAELETYHTVNEHFQNRYFLPLAELAGGVLYNFLEISLREGDRRLLDLACRTYPEFGTYFWNLVELEKASQTEQESPDDAAK